jgi:hypothetical protein
MPLAEAAAVVTTLKNAAELVQRLRGSDSKEELQLGVATLTEMLVNARVAALDILEEKALLMDQRTALNSRIDALERELRHLTDFSERSEKYARFRTPGGHYVYREKHQDGEPNFCPRCFLENKPSILVGRMSDNYHHCPVCRWGEYL